MYKITGIYPLRGIKDWEDKKGYHHASAPQRWCPRCTSYESRLLFGVEHRPKIRRDLRDIPF